MASVTLSDNRNNKFIKEDSKVVESIIEKKVVEVIIKTAISSSIKLIDFHTKPVSDGLLGWMGAHRNLVVKFQRESHLNQENITFFIKCIPYEREEQTSVIEESKLFYKETNFYRYIAPELLTSSKDKLWMAQCYLVQDSMIVFEDLTLKNFKIKEKLLELTSLRSACGAFAKLHAASILAEKRMSKTFYELYPDMFHESIFATKGRFNKWLRSGIEVMEVITKNLGLDSTNVSRVINRIFEKLTISKKWPNCLCHGDPWSFNLMFDDTQPLPKCVLLDFQAIRYVPASSDLLQLFYLTTRREFRDKNEKDLLRHYHQVLHATLQESGKDVNIPKIKEIFEEYEDMRIIGVVTASLYYPIMCIDSLKSAELIKKSDGFGNAFFNKRDHIVMNMMEEDLLYKERITEIAIELVERSNQLLA